MVNGSYQSKLICMMTDIPTAKENYILDAQNNRKNFYDTFISKKFENRSEKTKKIRKYMKIAKNLLKGSLITMDIFFKQLEN